jgi:hypothetical protein
MVKSHLEQAKIKSQLGRLYILAQVLPPRHLRLNNYQDQGTKLATFSIQAFEGEGDTFHKEKPQKNA